MPWVASSSTNGVVLIHDRWTRKHVGNATTSTEQQEDVLVSPLRSFLQSPANDPRKLLMWWFPVVAEVEHNFRVSALLPQLRDALKNIQGRLVETGILSSVSNLEAPNSACRELLGSQHANELATAASDSLREIVDQLVLLEQGDLDALDDTSFPAEYTSVHNVAISTIEKTLVASRAALSQLDDPTRQLSGEANTVLHVAYESLLGSNPQVVDDLQVSIQRLQIHLFDTHSAILDVTATIQQLAAALNAFQEVSAAFHFMTKTFPPTLAEAAMYLETLEQLRAQVQDTNIDCDLKVRQLRRRSLGEREREALEANIMTLRAESSKLRAQYRREHRVALKAVLRFYPELRARIVDKKELSLSNPFFDPSMSIECFTNLDRTYDNIQTGELDGKPVALKHFRVDQVGTFKRECTVYSAVQHPFVGEMLSAFSDDDGLVAVMPCYEGGIANVWAERHQDDAFLTVRLLRQVADGLRALHREGITHCDFKPQNIVMTGVGPEALPKLIDFGCSDVAETTTVLLNRMNTQTLHVLTGFTPQYIAPEVSKKLFEVSSPGADDPPTAESLTALVQPALDIYSFGRWMSETLKDASSSEKPFSLPLAEDADGAVYTKMLEQLVPHNEIINALVNAALDERPDRRPTAPQIAETLYHLERELQKQRDVNHVEETRVMTCTICSDEIKLKDCVVCQTPSRDESEAESHIYCQECLPAMLSEWRTHPVQEHVRNCAKITCAFKGCRGLLDGRSVLAICPQSLDDIQYVERKVSEFLAIESIKRQYENESLEQRAIREVEERILGMRCPKCKTSCAIADFKQCLAMNCPSCKANFCGYCEEVFRGSNATHSHVTANHRAADGFGLWTSRERWYAYWYQRKEPELTKFLSTLPEDVANKVKERFPKP